MVMTSYFALDRDFIDVEVGTGRGRIKSTVVAATTARLCATVIVEPTGT